MRKKESKKPRKRKRLSKKKQDSKSKTPKRPKKLPSRKWLKPRLLPLLTAKPKKKKTTPLLPRATEGAPINTSGLKLSRYTIY